MPPPSKPSDVMVTVALAVSGRGGLPDGYLAEVERLLAPRFRYFEILSVVAGLDEAGLRAAEAQLAGRRNGRLVVLDGDPSPERLSFAAASESLGDYVVVLHPDEIGPAEGLALLAAGLEGREVVRIRLLPSGRPLLDRAITRSVSGTLRLLTGRRIRPDAGRSVCLSRSAVAAVRDNHVDGRFMRFVDGPWNGTAEAVLPSAGARRRGRPSDYYRRSLLGLNLIAQAAPRILRGVALLSFLLSLAAAAYGAYASAVWLVRPGVAEGWTSLSLVVSALFSVLFLILAFVALGIVRLFDVLAGARPYRVEREASSLDMFPGLPLLNVESAEPDPPEAQAAPLATMPLTPSATP